jgi:hypothetical protein
MSEEMRKNRNTESAEPISGGIGHFLKKGLGSCNPMTSVSELSEMHLGWYYNWRPFEKIEPVPGVEFVPMFWGAEDVTEENLSAINGGPASHVLGFNEPDMEGQSNMTPEKCLELWPRLMTLKQKLGSPAPANWKWLEQFMPEANRRGLRVDFVCLHRYPDISNPRAAEEIERMIEGAYQEYGLPIWLTETGAADVSPWHQPQVSKPTPEMARSFVKELLPMLEGLPMVERYAWFADRVGKEYGLGTIFELNARGLTALGEEYRDGG